jgi:indolepyruvate ferredoxin oxidoreductase alpha subunit
MGAGIGVASGLGKLSQLGFDRKVFAVSGDSTFFHAAIPGLINARHKNADLTFIILDNQTTAMTGFQIHPGSKAQAASLTQVSIEKMVNALEPDVFLRADASDLVTLTDLLHETSSKRGLKVILLDSVCRLEEARQDQDEGKARLHIDEETCKGESCLICVRHFGCPAITWNNDTGRPYILQDICVRCGACLIVCPHGAIKEDE